MFSYCVQKPRFLLPRPFASEDLVAVLQSTSPHLEMHRASKSPKIPVKRASSFSEEESEGESKVAVETKPKDPVTLQKVFVRSATATALALLYLGLLQTGHLYCILSIMIIQVGSIIVEHNSTEFFSSKQPFLFLQVQLYREIVNVRYVDAKERAMPLFRSLQWSWFVVAMVFVCK